MSAPRDRYNEVLKNPRVSSILRTPGQEKMSMGEFAAYYCGYRDAYGELKELDPDEHDDIYVMGYMDGKGDREYDESIGNYS